MISKFLVALILIASLLLPLTTLTTTVGAKEQYTVVASFTDPTGDDNGPGTYTYPTNKVFQKGAFDLTGLKILENSTHIVFEVSLANLADNPWNGPNGFSLQYIQIYIRTTANMPLNTSTFGLNIKIEGGWHYAILLVPGWNGPAVPEGQYSAIYNSTSIVVDQESNLFTVKADNETNTITAIVAKSVFNDVENIAKWSFTVAIAGYDGFAPMKIRPIQVDVGEWNFGGADPKAVLAGVEPRVIDILAPTPEDQYKMLTSYNTETKEPAKIVLYSATPTLIASFTDPTGDDNGPGTYTYPTNKVFQKGAFDLTGFEVLENYSAVILKVKLANLADNPWNGPNGFSLQYIQIYIKTCDEQLPINKTTFGLNIEIWHGWNYAILMVPGWSGPAAPQGQLSALWLANNTLLATETENKTFDVYALPDENAIVAVIDKSLLSDLEDIANWTFVVAVAGYDGYSPLKIRAINVNASEWNFGGADPKAVLAGVEPRVIDILAPTPEDQYKMLTSYNTETKEPALVGGVNKELGLLLPQVTTTTTTTTTITTTTTTTTTTISPKPVTTTITKTETQTKTETVTTPSVTTVKLSEIRWDITVVVAIILLLLGIAIGYYLKK